jgi:arylsulfatase A-like enzyme
LLISIDALRHDIANVLGIHTPAIGEFAEKAHVFENAYSTGAQTPFSFPSILGSYYRIEQSSDIFFSDKPSVATVFRDAGFETIGIQAANPYLTSYFNYDVGFNYFEDFIPSSKKPSPLKASTAEFWNRYRQSIISKAVAYGKFILLNQFSEVDASKVVSTALNRLNSFDRKDNLFLWLHLMDTHNPLLPPKAYLRYRSIIRYGRDIFSALRAYSEKRIRSTEQLKTIKRLYSACVRYVDYNLGNLFSWLAAKDWYDDALIILTSDHGEAFLEHNFFGHPFENLYNEQLQVPLMVKLPGQKQQYRHLKRVSHIDLFPSVFAELEIARPADFRGKDMLFNSNPNSHPIFACNKSESGKWKIACIKNDWKLISQFGDTDIEALELYNLKLDPDEVTNQVDNNGRTVFELLNYTKNFYNKCVVEKEVEKTRVKNTEIENRLRTLGYM